MGLLMHALLNLNLLVSALLILHLLVEALPTTMCTLIRALLPVSNGIDNAFARGWQWQYILILSRGRDKT